MKKGGRKMKLFKAINVPFELKSIDEEQNIFEGYASVFRNVDHHGDVIEPGAFTKTIQERGHKVKVLWQHDPFTPIGKAIHLEEDNHGLFVRAKIFDTTAGRDAMTLIKGGVIDELSIGYKTIKDEWDKERGVRRIKEVQLFEFSPVTFAANPQAAILSAKHENDLTAALLTLNEELKAGRVLSDKNKELVKNAIAALQALLAAAEGNGEGSKGQKNDDDTEAIARDILKMMEEIKSYK
jgi:uncharacterized protein